jgi:glutathione S-transferase
VVLPAEALDLTSVRVYRIPFSTNVERVALAAAYKGIAVVGGAVDPVDRAAVREVSGQDLVPVLVAGDEVVHDSPVILDWLERRVPQPPLYPADPARRAEVETFLDWFNQIWKRPPNLIAAEEGKPTPDTERIAELFARMRAALDRFEALLSGRDFLFGELGVVDMTAFPFLKYAGLGLPPGDDERFHAILVEGMPLDDHPRVRAWIERVDALPRA